MEGLRWSGYKRGRGELKKEINEKVKLKENGKGKK
jgi:hypothetical protein